MIKLGRLTDYAIVILSHMAPDEKAVYATSDLAERTALPGPATAKILKKLTKSGMLTAQRGVKGGYRLTQTAKQMSIADIIEAMEGPLAITACSDMKKQNVCCRIGSSCHMRPNWGRVNMAVRMALENVSLADMMEARQEGRDDAEIPPRAAEAGL